MCERGKRESVCVFMCKGVRECVCGRERVCMWKSVSVCEEEREMRESEMSREREREKEAEAD